MRCNHCDKPTTLADSCDGVCSYCYEVLEGKPMPRIIMNKLPQSATQYAYQVIFIHRDSSAYVQFNDVYALCGEDAVRFARDKLADPSKYVFVALTGEIHANRRDY